MAAKTEGLIVERHGSVLLLVISREHRRNALDAATSSAIDIQIGEAESDPTIGATIITGNGERAFCSGMDMKEAAEIGIGRGLVPGNGFAGITERHRAKPLIAAINGFAVAGGFEIALACDIVIAADHAMFGLSEVKRGLFAFAGGVQRLAQQVPRSTALSLILTGEPVSAQRLYDIGVVSEVVPIAQLRERALAFAQAMLKNSWEAMRNGKLLYEMAANMPIEQSMQLGGAFGRATLASADSLTGVAAYAQGSVKDKES